MKYYEKLDLSEQYLVGSLLCQPYSFKPADWNISSTKNITMLTPRIVSGTHKIVRRNFGMVAPALQKATDPIQQLFLDKVREYKSKSVDGKLVDPTPEIEKERKSELEKLATQYGGGHGADMTAFPTFKFSEPKVVLDGEAK